MLDYVRQRPSPTISLSSLSFLFIRLLVIFFMFFNLFSLCLHDIDTKPIEKHSLKTIFQLRNTRTVNQPQKKFLRIIYFREFDMTIHETRLKSDVKNLTESHDIDFKLNILDQSRSFSIAKLCSIISEERRDTILIADLYTKEIDLISRSLKIPTIAITNRYQIVQGKLHNPYLFKLMPDAIEEAKTVAYTIDSRSVYTRIALIYDVSLDMVEFRLSYLRLAKQHIVYRALLPRISFSHEFNHAAHTIIYDLARIDIHLILCIMSTERETQFVRLIKEFSSTPIKQLLLNRTSWWFASRLDEMHELNYFPKIFTASEDRRRTLSNFSSTSMKILLNAVLKTYIRLPDASAISSLLIGSPTCDSRLNQQQLRKTHMFIKLFTNFTEWNCDIRVGSGVDPILFEPKTLVWRVPTMFMVHTEHLCRGMLTRLFYTANTNADQFFRSCRSTNLASRKSSSSPPDNTTTSLSTTFSNALVDMNGFLKMFGKLWDDSTRECRFVRILTHASAPIVVGVVEPPYVFVSDAQISSEFHCNYGIPCYQIDPPLTNMSMDPFIFQSITFAPPHCCYGISINLLLRMEDSNSVLALKTRRLFVYSDKPNKWVALTKALEDRRAHLSISAIPYESFLARSIDLSPPFYHSSYVIFTAPAPTRPSLGVFLQPFSWTTWLMIFLVLNCAALFETFFEWHSPYGLTPKGRRRQKVFSLASALTLTWSIVFSHTFKTKSPKCWSNRFLGNVWGGFGIVFIAIYTAKLAAFMVEIAETQTATNVQGIVDECRKTAQCSIGVVANTSDEEYIKRFFTNSLYTHMQYVSSYAHGIELLRARSITYLLMDHSMARYYLTREVFKSIRISGDNFGAFGLALGFSKFDQELKNNITNILLSYVDKGIIQRLHDDWYVYENCEIKRLNENRMLSVDRFIGVFILLAGGMIVGLITLLLEWLTFKYAVPYWRRRQWPGWMFCSQRLYATLNASDEVYTEGYHPSKSQSSRCVGERLHNYSTRSDSLDLRVVDVPKLLCTTYQLKEQMHKINEQQPIPLLPPNGILSCAPTIKEEDEEQELIRTRIKELEQELNHLKLQVSIFDKT
ncbi:unnamed protein product [Rotaria socialis]|uniref:Ionotropic glutamate receptor C-terminal domain-containing protein n=2 Tax=Rotaria socialis TaxID=392032 RepID=A0A820HHK9_9BILA|nr:unnamed protein product [Rotaria socialis]CAF3463810.1 unnamed protein product [Rotaria socialis]CAF3554908.1 unnamed protein product [Rotaria socialis]CAF3560691.1 unnamed protein product [Rotaria socialis]CAF4296060.1 unnamed protein product [Rotaria socialis]